jgi:tryptophan 2-C-methyltransferase
LLPNKLYLQRERMISRQPLLINANVVRPLVSPVGLEYVGEALVEAQIPVRVLDLSFEASWKASLRKQLAQEEPLFIGLSVRNTDDCSFVTKKSFLPWIGDIVTEIRKLSKSYIVLGGVGFSVMPEAVLETTGADFGIAGDGEEIAVALARRFNNNDPVFDLPNLVYRHQGRVVSNKRSNIDLVYLPVPRRRLFDNKRYEELGAMVGIETKRGCAQRCIFCADPVAKGSQVRLRTLSNVVQEFNDLLSQGVSWFHLSDSEFNQPINHAKEICQAIIEAGLANKLKWYCYCSPCPFDSELARLMVRAGCRGINFGVDSLCDAQLLRLGRNYSLKEIQSLVKILKEAKINYIFDLLIGGPGETAETVKISIQTVRELDIPLVGIAIGVRIYPNTPLGEAVAAGFGNEGLHSERNVALHHHSFYVSKYLGDNVSGFMRELVNDDPRFLSLVSPDETGSYNYAGDEKLFELIQAGARGAYWEIIRHNRSTP